VKELASKDYQSLIKEQGLDYVFMFVPVEQAYIEAISADPDIYADAYKSRIAVTTASSLLPVLRTVQNLWQIERQNKNVLEIAKIGGQLYDKLDGFVRDMEGVDKALKNARSNYDDAMKKLATGRGNAIGLAEKMKTLGAKASKSLPAELIDRAEMIEYGGEG
ncbi:MAG TPA: DNA recombination protein RmuC, partial [Alphaproteobacteria bacterium]|nr:DNA recombination protein RmuC [Alphaproteobacteria bacterium]